MSDTVQEPGTMRPTTPADVSKGTAYVVLRASIAEQDGDEHGWFEIDTVHATSPDGAIRKAAVEREGTYVAVPARSFQPRTLAVKTERRAVLS